MVVVFTLFEYTNPSPGHRFLHCASTTVCLTAISTIGVVYLVSVQPALVRLGTLDSRDAFWRSACCKSFVVLIVLAAVVRGMHLWSEEYSMACCLPLLALEVGFVVMSCAFTTA